MRGYPISQISVSVPAWFMASRRLWEGVSLPKQPKKHSIAASSGELKATFGTDLVCVVVCKPKQCTTNEGDDHMPMSRVYIRAQYPLLMA